jgi:catechol 2,3-dioxygenase-like lactoylglutathione lyase family enzyme
MMDDERMTADEHTDPPAALRALDDVVAPDRLRHAVEATVADAERSRARGDRRLRLRLGGALAAAGAVAAVLLVVLVLGGGSGDDAGGATPTVRQVARVALRPSAAPAPATVPGGEVLTAHAGPIAFPTWTRAGWRAVGERTDTTGGHELRTVFYVDGDGRRIGYAIADADLPVGGGRVVVRRGVPVRVLAHGKTAVVTWRRDGRTCILAGRGVPVGKLVTLASYSA